MPDIQVQPDHYDYTTEPVENDVDSELPLELDGDVTYDETPVPVSTVPVGSIADALRTEVGKRTTPTFTMRVPGRDGWSMKFRLDWSEAEQAAWEKQAQDRTKENGVNASKLFRRTIADQCVALILNGQEAREYAPKPFQSKQLQALFGVQSATAAVEKWLPIFSTQLLPVANAITRATQSGTVDPTDPD